MPSPWGFPIPSCLILPPNDKWDSSKKSNLAKVSLQRELEGVEGDAALNVESGISRQFTAWETKVLWSQESGK